MKRNAAIAVLQLVLIAPAAFFMFSLFARGAFPPAPEAERVVQWYAARLWTLWLLLFALPLAALIAGGAALMRKQSLAVLRAHFATVCVSVMALASAGILAVVVLHMAAN
jgi:hypothetical protein